MPKKAGNVNKRCLQNAFTFYIAQQQLITSHIEKEYPRQLFFHCPADKSFRCAFFSFLPVKKIVCL
jgi:hypothetical protein